MSSLLRTTRDATGLARDPQDPGRGRADAAVQHLKLVDDVEVPGGESCCESAGSYSLLRARDSRRVLEPKLDAIEALGT